MAFSLARSVLGALLFLWSVACVWSDTVYVYVSPTSGADSNDGRSPSHPVKTLDHTLELIEYESTIDNTAVVELMEGYHEPASTLHFQYLNDTVFRAYLGQEVHVVGGTRIPSSQFHHVTDPQALERLPAESRDKVLELDLTAAGITDLGTLTPYGFGITWTAPMEIFINGNALRLAEWPNYNFINIKSVPDGRNSTRFTYDAGGRDGQWAKETEPWVYGWWYWSWADLSVPVSRVDPASHTIYLKHRTNYGLRAGHYDPTKRSGQAGNSEQGGYFRVINMLCELDQPGEYYIDRISKKLYVWPNTPQQTLTSSDIVYVSMLNDCFLIDSTAQNLTFANFTIEAYRHNGFELNNAIRVTIRNLEIKNTGGNAVHGGCQAVSVLASDIHDVGGGVHISGGDRTNLMSSENVISDNHIWLHARTGATANSAVAIGGVHVTVSYNHLHHGQYVGLNWGGNDHVIEYNHVHHMCWNASDCGAMSTGRDWTFRGNVIRNNHIHDVQRHFPGADTRGIMLDDQYSAVTIENNVFYNNDLHTNIGGGRDNILRYNVMYNGFEEEVEVDGRGLSNPGNMATLYQKLQASPYRSPLWKSRYPKLYSILDHDPKAPEGNEIYTNIFYQEQNRKGVNYHGTGLNRSDYFDIHDNYPTSQKADFQSPDNADFRLRGEAAQWASKMKFPQPVTLDEVGPRVPTGPYYLRDKAEEDCFNRPECPWK